MVDLNDIHSLTDFQRNAKEHIKRIKQTGKPHVLTVNGKAEVVVQDAGSYQALLETIERLEAIAGINKGLDNVLHDKVSPAKEAFSRMRDKFKIP